MTIVMGNFSLSIAMLVSMLSLVACLAALRFNSAQMLRAAKWGIGLHFGLLTLSSIALFIALIQSDFRLDYVSKYTERALPLGYKLAAFWAGQEGSLLLWAWLLAGMSSFAVFTIKPIHEVESATESAGIIGTLAVVCTFFAALMLFAANPFKLTDITPADGHGLNPMLQDPGMIAHPPLLFLGYAGYTIPFALFIGAMLAGRRDGEWLTPVRKWAVLSWLFLSIGIILGAQWAYVELGWGGYWAWDPVENASLLPWLTGTALLHSIMVQQHRGMFKKWNASLIAISFILCIFGTYLTRSGVIDSVHGFGASLVGTFFFVFLIVITLLSIFALIASRKLLAPERELDGLVGKEGFFLATNGLLVGMTIITLIGTTFPIISNVISGQQVTVGPNFYNKVVAPLGLILAALMAVGPLLVYGKDAARKLARDLAGPTLFAAGVVVALYLYGVHNAWALIAGAIAAISFGSILVDLVRSTIIRVRSHNQNAISAILHLLDSNHRRYGGQIVHVGMILIIVGITGSSLFNQKETFSMKPGQSVQFAGRTITLSDVRNVPGGNFSALQATLLLSTNNAEQDILKPQIRQYSKWEEQMSSEVSIRSNWREDVYVMLAASDGDGGVTVQAILNPLVSWIWTGGFILTVGGIICLSPKLIPSHQAADEAVHTVEVPGSVVPQAAARPQKNGRKNDRPQKNVPAHARS